MYGFSSNTDLRFLVGREVLQVAIGKFQVVIHFDSDVSLTVEGDCQIGGVLFGPGVVAGSHLVHLIGHVVISAKTIDERHLELRFDDDANLKVLEGDDKETESFTITGPEVTIVV